MSEPRDADPSLRDHEVTDLDDPDGLAAGPTAGGAVDVPPGATEEGSAEEGQLAYDCAAWAGETRSVLRSLLVSQDIPHAWQGTTLAVREEDEEAVDLLIDEVAGSAQAALDPDATKVVYEVGAWPAALQSQLADALTTSDVPYEWDERGDLVVLEADEDQVEVLLADLPDPEESTISSDDGVAVHQLLDSIFMSSDRLARNAGDAAGTVGLVDSAAVVEQLALPFGFEPGQWRTFVTTVQELRDALEGDSHHGTAPVTDDQIEGLAQRLRDLVRVYI